MDPVFRTLCGMQTKSFVRTELEKRQLNGKDVESAVEVSPSQYSGTSSKVAHAPQPVALLPENSQLQVHIDVDLNQAEDKHQVEVV